MENKIHAVVLKSIEDYKDYAEEMLVIEPRNIERAIKANLTFLKEWQAALLLLTKIGTKLELLGFDFAELNDAIADYEKAVAEALKHGD